MDTNRNTSNKNTEWTWLGTCTSQQQKETKYRSESTSMSAKRMVITKVLNSKVIKKGGIPSSVNLTKAKARLLSYHEQIEDTGNIITDHEILSLKL